MSENIKSIESEKNSMSIKKTVIISLLILLAGGVFTTLIFLSEPKAVRGGAVKKTAMLVDVIKAEYGTFRPYISSTGIVKPSQDIILKPQIGGEVIWISEDFIPGGFIKKGKIILKIEPADYRNILKQRKSDLRLVIADLKIEMGRQNVAQKDYKLLEETLTEEHENLILRKPQLNAARAKVESARAVVKQAELELKRTVIKAPFDAHILIRNVNIGSQISRSENLGRFVGIDKYWVETSVPVSKLRWFEFPDSPETIGSTVIIRNRSAWQEEEYRQGYLYKMVGALENGTRLARVLITLSDPLSRRKDSSGLPKLMIGSFVETKIKSKHINNVIRLKRDYIRKRGTVWVMKDSKLRICEVGIILQDEEYAYIRSGLRKDELIVTTNLSSVVEGTALRLESSTFTNVDHQSIIEKKKQNKADPKKEKP